MNANKIVVAAAAAAAMLAPTVACSSGSGGTAGGSSSKASSSTSPLTVWVDADRAPQAKVYVKAHPNVKITVNIVDASQGANTSKIALAEKAGSGVPDVIFLGSPDEISTLNANPINYPLALNGLVPQSTLDGFADPARCTYDGKVYCVGNDLGQTVLWYNKVLFAKFGYSVPTTFDQFKALGLRLVKEHPGYDLGTVNGRYGLDAYFGSSGCPIIDATGVTTVKIDTSSVNCTRVGDVIGPLMANGALSTLDLFDKNYTAKVANGKVLAMVGASWIADFAFKPMTTNSGTSFKAPGQYAAAPMPTWAGATTNYSGAVGGGIWIVSRTTKNQTAAVNFAVAMTTSPVIAKTQTTYPAYNPNATIWLKAKAVDPFYAANPALVLQAAASKVNPADGYVRYQTQVLDSFNSTIIKNGATNMAGALAALGQQASAAAQADGYTVSK